MKKNYFSGWNLVINFLIAFIPANIIFAFLKDLVTIFSRYRYQRLLSEGVDPEELAAEIAMQAGLLIVVTWAIVLFGSMYLVGLLRKKFGERKNKLRESK
jgi:hypothetical protein